MPMYINHFVCNAAAWPTDHEGQITVWTDMTKDAEELVEGESAVVFTGWISNTEGYVLLKAESKTEVMRICAKFWPLFHNDIMECVPTAEAGKAILAGATEGWQSN